MRRARVPVHHYPRMARVNRLLLEVLAEEIELATAADPQLELVTVTAVDCDPDLRHATVLFASLPEPAREALAAARPRLQAAIARQVRMRRTPQLRFEADPSVAYGERVEGILRELRSSGQLPEGDAAGAEDQGDGAGADGAGGEEA